jgi:maleylpyruvate isomerase
MKLFGYWRSSCTWRVRIGLNFKAVPFEYVPVHLVKGGGAQHAAGFRALNPMGQVPVLVVEDGAENRQITQSLAILEYLEQRFPEPPLLPANALERARARELAEMINAGIQPLQNSGVLRHVEELTGGDSKAWAVHFISRGLGALEQVAARTAGRFLVGDEVTLADLCLVPQLYNARRYAIDVRVFPTLCRVEEACAKIEAFEKAHPDRQPDAEPGA